MLENLVTWSKFTFAVYVTLKLFEAPCKRTQHRWPATPNIVKSCCNVDATLLDVTLVLEGDWTPPTMLNLLLYHWLISFVDLRASSSFYFTAWFSRLRPTLGFKQLIPGWVSPASETETQLNGAGYSTPGSLNLFPAPSSRGENGVSLARILGLNHVNRRPCSPSRHIEREKASLPVDISVTQKRLWLSSLLGDRCVLSYDPRYICGTHFGFSFVIVSKTANYKQN